ncbi:MAG: Nif3-like dinuclear metal center hexameric protein [Planctomycetota bacterium]
MDSGRYGILPNPQPAAEIIRRCGQHVGASTLRGAGDTDQLVSKVGFACGSGGSFVSDASRRGCQLLITGEATFHGCLEAEALGITLGLLGHYQSERFAMERLAERLSNTFPDLSIWSSESEHDPISTL